MNANDSTHGEVPVGYQVLPEHALAPLASIVDTRLMAWVRLEAEHENRAKPWMLVSLRGERLVAKRRTWPWRAITWWHNIWRRRERERIGRAELARLEDRAHRMAAGIPLEDGSKQ